MPGKDAAPKDPVRAALRLISYRPRSVAELRERLLARGYEAAEVEKTVTELRGAGYLDDEKFAALLADSRARNKHWGPAKIIFELKQRGVPAEVVRKTVSSDPEAEEATAAEALAKWLKKSGSPARLDTPGSARAYRFLKGRGFSSDSIFKAIAGFRGQAAEDSPEER